MNFSMIRLRRDASPREIASLIKGDGYRLHKLVWDMFSDGPERDRDFLYRHETVNCWPTFYTVSAREPNDLIGLWETSIKKYDPKIVKGDCLSFKLRANPVHVVKKERTVAEIEAWQVNRAARGFKEKEPTKKRIRHDVIMAEKSRIGFSDLPQDGRPHVTTLVQNAGLSWLKEHADENGFSFEDANIRSDGYFQHRLFKGKGVKPITFSTLEFNGILSVTDAEKFINKCLFNGIGPAKGFGCGLMMVRRV